MQHPSIKAGRTPLGAITAATTSVRTIAVTSGKGGVGKTNFVVNVGLELASLGQRVTLFDADMALANADVLMGLHHPYHIGHALSGARTLNEVVVKVSDSVRLIPGSSGVEDLNLLSCQQHERLINELEDIESDSDFLIVDTAAGVGNNVINLLRAAYEVVVVTTPEPTAMVDAYATIKVLHKYAPRKRIWVAVNNVLSANDAAEAFGQLYTVCSRFLNHHVEYLGSIPRSTELLQAVRVQRPVVEYAPDNPASRSFRLIAKHLSNQPLTNNSPESFWRTYIGGER